MLKLTLDKKGKYHNKERLATKREIQIFKQDKYAAYYKNKIRRTPRLVQTVNTISQNAQISPMKARDRFARYLASKRAKKEGFLQRARSFSWNYAVEAEL
jgi:hypothetical protein